MSVTQIDLDDALTEVLRRSGLKTKKEAVNAALRGYAAKRRRAAEFDGYIQRAREWDDAGWKEVRALDRSGHDESGHDESGQS